MPNSHFQRKIKLKTYILFGIIGVLVVTNGVLFFQNRQEKSEINTQNTFQSQALQSEIMHLEEQLNASENISKSLEQKWQNEKNSVQSKLKNIKSHLQKQKTNTNQIELAKREIVELRNFVKQYQLQIDSLQKENELLNRNNQLLNHKITNADQKIERLSQTLEKGKFFQIQHLEVTAFKKRFGRKSPTEKATRAENIQIQFEVSRNPLLEKGKYPFYIRIFDPLGNLIAQDKDIFKFKDETLQYTLMSHIDYQNENTTLNIKWKNPRDFEKGKYVVLIYAQNRIIGETELFLK